MDSDFSLEDYRWERPPESIRRLSEVAGKKTQQPGKFFFKGPVPMDWIARLVSLPGKASHLGWLIWFMSGLKKHKTFRLEPKWYGLFGLNRKAVYSGLKALEEAKLITVKRKPDAAPEVAILDGGSTDSIVK